MAVSLMAKNVFTGVTRRFTELSFKNIPTKIVNDKPYANGGWNRVSSEPKSNKAFKPAFVPPEILETANETVKTGVKITRDDLEEMGVRDIVKLIKDNGYDIKTTQSKQLLIDALIKLWN